MATSFCFPSFDEAQDKWDIYLTRIEAYFEGNGITTQDKKRALLVAALATKTISVLAGSCAPRKVNELSYEEAVSLLNQHYAPKQNEIAASYKFFSRSQADGETLQEYVVELRKLANECNFGTSLQRMLRDRTVCGIRDRTVQRTLLARAELTFAEAEAIAAAAEAAAREVGAMTQPDNSDASVCNLSNRTRYNNYTRGSTGKIRQSGDCARCGGRGHRADECRNKNAQCFRCGKQGHFAKKCRAHSGRQRSDVNDKGAHALQSTSEPPESEESDIATTFAVQQAESKQSVTPSFRRLIRWGGRRPEHDNRYGIAVLHRIS